MTAGPAKLRPGPPTLACLRCEWRATPSGYLTGCPDCGGLLDAAYDLGRVRLGDPDGDPNGDPLSRFADLLPCPPGSVPAGHGITSTPLIRLDGARYGVGTVLLKWEGAHPTGSTKDPMALVALAHLYARGVRAFAFSSTGNTTAAFARALPYWPDLRAHVFVPAGFPVPPVVPANLHVHLVPGDYVLAQRAARDHCRDGVTAEGGFASVGRREGLKVAYLEALLAAPVPVSVAVQAVSSGMGTLAAARAVAELAGLGLRTGPVRLVAAQQQSCAPMVSAFRAGAPAIRPADVVPQPAGLAVATLLGDPSASYPYVRAALLRTGGTLIGVCAQDMVTARDELAGLGLDVCFSAATALAAVRRLVAAGQAGDGDVVLVNLTGSRRSLAGQCEAGVVPAGNP